MSQANVLGNEVSLDRAALAQKLAEPLAQLMTSQGSPTSESDIRKLLLSPNTKLDFPIMTLTHEEQRGVVVVRVRVRVVVRTSVPDQPGPDLVLQIEEHAGGDGNPESQTT